MHPAASIEYQIRRRTRARLQVNQHPVLPDHLLLSFGDGDATIELGLSAGDADRLALNIGRWLDALPAPAVTAGQPEDGAA